MKLDRCTQTSRWMFLFSIFLVFSSLRAQDPEKYDAIFTKTYIETSQKDFERSLEVADSLFLISETPFFQAKSLMLKASLYEQAGKLNKSIKYAEQAEGFIEKSDNYSWHARIQGFLATQYRLLALYSQSEKYANKAVAAAEKIKDKEVHTSTLAMLLQEKAFLADTKENYKQALDLFKEAGTYFGDAENNYLVAQNYQFKGQCALNLQEYDEAFTYLETALRKWGDLPNNFVKGLIYIGLAEVHIHFNELELAKENLDRATEIAKDSSYLEYLSKYYSTLFTYYTLTSNIEHLREAGLKRDSIQGLLNAQKNQYIDQSYAELDNQKVEIGNQKLKRDFIILGGGLVFLAGLIYFFYYQREKNRQVKMFKSILSEYEKSKKINQLNQEKFISIIQSNGNGKSKNENIEVDQESFIMSEEVEERILKQLEKFEKTDLFTKNSISFSSLASYCQTNTKYLSHCINHHKGMDYNNYINDLRVKFIIDKLINEPIYRKYKFGALAEEAGFSSQNKFSTVFKKSTSITPSEFIKQLDPPPRTTF